MSGGLVQELALASVMSASPTSMGRAFIGNSRALHASECAPLSAMREPGLP